MVSNLQIKLIEDSSTCKVRLYCTPELTDELIKVTTEKYPLEMLEAKVRKTKIRSTIEFTLLDEDKIERIKVNMNLLMFKHNYCSN